MVKPGTPTNSQDFAWNQESAFEDWLKGLNSQGWFLDKEVPMREENGQFVYTFIQLVHAHAHPNEAYTDETQTHDEGDGQS